MEGFVKVLAKQSVAALELLGILVICLVVLLATVRATVAFAKRTSVDDMFREYRQHVIRGILMGLDLLVASDIIRTVAVDFNFIALATLSIIVAIRTLLSFTLEVEMSGKWPWQGG